MHYYVGGGAWLHNVQSLLACSPCHAAFTLSIILLLGAEVFLWNYRSVV